MIAAETLTNLAEFTVSELSFAIKRTVEDAFGLVRLRGEISGFRGQHSSGHAYFTLKDDRAKIDAVVWRGTFGSLKFKPEEGLEVIATGRVTTFPGKSSYQIIIEALEPAGIGALMALLEERRKKLAAEGLFDEARKKPLPFWPQVIGIVTSPTGAVIRDMLHGFTERCPCHVLVWPVRVQGETCASEVAAAILGFNALAAGGAIPRPELLIVARGGGSLEDLWGFNEESIVRAVAGSLIPLISAVGHETDWTLIDHVADARAPTPTKAAEWAVPRHSDLAARLLECGGRLRICAIRGVERARAELRGAERGLPRPAALLGAPRQRLDLAGERLGQSLQMFTHRSRARLDRSAIRLSPRLIHQRLDRCTDRMASLGRELAQCFRAASGRKQRIFDRIGGRLRPGLVAVPASLGRERLAGFSARQGQAASALLKQKRIALQRPADRLRPALLARPLARLAERFADAGARKRQSFDAGLARKRARLEAQALLLGSLSHKSVLERGFALVRNAGGAMVRRKAELAQDQQTLEIEFADGRVSAHTGGLAVRNNVPISADRRDTRTNPSRNSTAKRDDDGQGNLL
jgi:exodeoxyribonuclease VII large subunit